MGIIKQTVEAKELSSERMANGNEAEVTVVIDDGIVKEWVGIGWIEIRTATEEDYQDIPLVTHDT